MNYTQEVEANVACLNRFGLPLAEVVRQTSEALLKLKRAAEQGPNALLSPLECALVLFALEEPKP